MRGAAQWEARGLWSQKHACICTCPRHTSLSCPFLWQLGWVTPSLPKLCSSYDLALLWDVGLRHSFENELLSASKVLPIFMDLPSFSHALDVSLILLYVALAQQFQMCFWKVSLNLSYHLWRNYCTNNSINFSDITMSFWQSWKNMEQRTINLGRHGVRMSHSLLSRSCTPVWEVLREFLVFIFAFF